MANRVLVLAIVLVSAGFVRAAATVVVDRDAAPRVLYGREKLEQAIEAAGIGDGRIIVTKVGGEPAKKEGFSLNTAANGDTVITANDDSGALYGCLELARRIRSSKTLQSDLNFSDAPIMVLRGPCIGMQKTNTLPGRRVYEYPYTPESFPFFYDKQF